jgi:NADH-quinone oxidoreductase subunit L
LALLETNAGSLGFALVFGGLTKIGLMAFLEKTFANHFVNLNIGSLASIGQYELVEAAGQEPLLVLWLPLIVAVAGLAIAFVIYYLRIVKLGPLASMKNPVYRLLYRRYYQHEIYTEFFSLGIVYGVIAFLSQFLDVVIDSIVEAIGIITIGIGEELRRVQTGVIQTYATAVITGVSLLIILITLIKEAL